jgi:putative phage-type endonuclease
LAQPAEKLEERARPYDVVCDTSVEQDWLDARMQGIGASEIALVLGEAPESWGSALSLYAQKIGKYERDLSEVEAVYWGKKLEGAILSAYWDRTGRRTEKESLLLRSTEHPWALCTLDGRTWEPANDFERWPLEIKNVSAFKAEEWVDGPPPHYYLQIQQQMLVTGESRSTIAALLGGQRMVWADVPRDEDTIRRIVYHGSRFWERVQARDVPAPDGSEGTRRALHALYPAGSGSIVLPHVAAEAADELEALKGQLRSLEKRKDVIENTVRAALGDAEVGFLTDGRSFSWKLQSRRECVIPATSFRVLRLHNSKGKK